MKNPQNQLFNYLQLALKTTILLSFTNPTFSQNTLDNTGLTSSTPSSAAYSMRKLSTAYNGFALQVRRSSDNTTQDIGFTAGGELDTVTLKTFVGGGNGYVTTWYDQSGNGRNLTQATNEQQPELVAGGVIHREQNKPFIRFWGLTGAGNQKSLNLSTGMTTVGHVSVVIRFVTGGHGFILSHTGFIYWHSSPGASLIDAGLASTSVKNGSGWFNANAMSPTSMPWPSTLSLVELEPQTPSSNTTWNNIGSDRNCCHNITGGGGYSELILFSSALPATDRQNMETSQKNYFSIGVSLPVTWLSFSVEQANGAAMLNWQTASELNTRSFVVQRSSNGTTWTDMATIAAQGENNRGDKYHYKDRHPLPGNNYYRIKDVDADGKAGYSIIKMISNTQQQPIFTVLNNNWIRVNKPTNISLYNSAGQIVWIKKFANGDHAISFNQQPRGIYVLVADGSSQKMFIQ